MILRTAGLILWLAAAAAAQIWEIGASAGDAMYKKGTISSSAGSVQASIDNSVVPSVAVCENMYEHLSGEFRYLYETGHPFLSQGATKTQISGDSHTFVYDELLHFRRRASWWRPYVAVGGGAKYYVASGPAPVPQPSSKVALLLANNQWVGVGSAGAGLKLKVQEHVVLRFDVRDFISQFPKNQLKPAAGASAPTILQQITPMGGIGIVF